VEEGTDLLFGVAFDSNPFTSPIQSESANDTLPRFNDRIITEERAFLLPEDTFEEVINMLFGVAFDSNPFTSPIERSSTIDIACRK
jgi:hypothetical protein